MPNACSIRVHGVVQGVGFRPFVYRLARENTLAGWVLNGDQGVEIHLEGDDRKMEAFVREMRSKPPAAASIAEVEVEPALCEGLTGFTIRESHHSERPTVRVSSDLPICEDCLRECFDPENPRYEYPYINCTNCGPRYSVVIALPYDRVNTTMRGVAAGRLLRHGISRSGKPPVSRAARRLPDLWAKFFFDSGSRQSRRRLCGNSASRGTSPRWQDRRRQGPGRISPRLRRTESPLKCSSA